ncbi:unnamed protein product [Rhizophagus irregularis]|nr:unnamed protein product [Rhizophagus irregularis]
MCEYEGSIDLYKKSCVYDPHLIWLLSGDAGRYLPPATRTISIKSEEPGKKSLASYRGYRVQDEPSIF